MQNVVHFIYNYKLAHTKAKQTHAMMTKALSSPRLSPLVSKTMHKEKAKEIKENLPTSRPDSYPSSSEYRKMPMMCVIT